jgi:hypothetical protein
VLGPKGKAKAKQGEHVMTPEQRAEIDGLAAELAAFWDAATKEAERREAEIRELEAVHAKDG